MSIDDRCVKQFFPCPSPPDHVFDDTLELLPAIIVGCCISVRCHDRCLEQSLPNQPWGLYIFLFVALRVANLQLQPADLTVEGRGAEVQRDREQPVVYLGAWRRLR